MGEVILDYTYWFIVTYVIAAIFLNASILLFNRKLLRNMTKFRMCLLFIKTPYIAFKEITSIVYIKKG